MTIGKKNRRIEIWKRTGEIDGANQPLPDAWELHKERWAEVKGETGMGGIRSAASAGGINTPLDRYSYRIYYDRTITIGMQLRDNDGSRLEIVAIRHDKAGRKWTDIITEQGGPGG